MKKITLICAVLLMGFMSACEAEEGPAPTAFLPAPTETDATADSSDGDVVADSSDTASAGDTASTDDTAVVEEDQVSETDEISSTNDAGPTEDATAEDVSAEDVFVPETPEGACKAAGNPSEAKFGDTADQTAVLRTALKECFKGGPEMEVEDFFSCIREAVTEVYGCTDDCAQCFAIRADCMKTFCWSGCMMSSSSDVEECAQCQVENYCLNPFPTCTGLSAL